MVFSDDKPRRRMKPKRRDRSKGPSSKGRRPFEDDYVPPKPGDPEAGLAELQGQGQTHVAEAQHGDARIPRLDAGPQILQPTHLSGSPTGGGGAGAIPGVAAGFGSPASPLK